MKTQLDLLNKQFTANDIALTDLLDKQYLLSIKLSSNTDKQIRVISDSIERGRQDFTLANIKMENTIQNLKSIFLQDLQHVQQTLQEIEQNLVTQDILQKQHFQTTKRHLFYTFLLLFLLGALLFIIAMVALVVGCFYICKKRKHSNMQEPGQIEMTTFS